MMRRLPQSIAGEWIDRRRSLQLEFEGQPVRAFEGDTLSSALAATGVMTTARSFKYHRRRGLFSAAGHDANNLFQIGHELNQRGDQILARDGMSFSAVNTRGGVARDHASVIGLLARFLPVGFYYKAFLGRRSFPWFERIIRSFSGLGKVSPDHVEALRQRRYQHCDVAIIGAGVAGLSAALSAAEHGARRIVIIEETSRPGGSGLWHANTRPQDTARCRELIERLGNVPAVEVLCSHSVVGHYADHELAVSRIDREDGGLILLRARAVVMATGCIEQPAVFRNNDLPGVLLGSAAQRLLYRHGISAGERIVVLGANDEAIALALDLASHGLKVTDLAVPQDSPIDPAALPLAALRSAGIRVHGNVRSIAAYPGNDGTLAAVEWSGASGVEQVSCDALLVSTGWMPALQLALQAGGSIRFDAVIGQHVPATLPAGLFVTGRANGHFDFSARAADGAAAGRQAARHAVGNEDPAPHAAPRDPRSHSHAEPLFAHEAGKEFVDLDEDLTLGDLANAAQEGFDSVELLKRYSTVGMGPSQGKLSNLNAARQLARVTGQALPSLGMTTARPPWQPVSLGALAGARLAPLRRTALDAWHEAHGAIWMPAGNWRRPAHYGSITAEVQAVRNAAGLIDVSTLGKIEVMGKDAGVLLDRMYVGMVSDLVPGRTRYAVMVDEAGTIIDDGVVARLADRFYVTTTTGGSTAIYRELQRRVAEWQLDCTLHNLTGHCAAMNLAGPRSRAILAACTALPLQDSAFPYLALREEQVAGAAARIARVGFVGELGFEIHLSYPDAQKVWDALMDAGAAAGIRPFGVEAQRILRLEKGHIIVGQDTDGVTNPFEAGMSRMLRMNKPFFNGQRSLQALQRRGDRQQLAGFSMAGEVPLKESNLAIHAGDIVGRITSVAFSPTLGRTIGLALLTPQHAASDSVQFRDDQGALHTASITPTPFYDPQGARQRSGAQS